MIVTSPYNLKTIRKKTADTAALGQSVILIDSTFTLGDQVNELTAFLIHQSEDQYPVPTKEFMVTYFPKQQVLVSGCLYNKPLIGHEIINQRKPALRRFISENKLNVKYIIPTNTDSLSGFENICTLEMLDQTLKEGINPDSVSISLINLSLEYIESKRDSLVDYFEIHLPRSFDMQVLINCLYYDYYDLNRGIQIAKVAATLFPEDFIIYWMIGNGYRFKKDYIEAFAYYEKSVALADSQSNSRWVSYINKLIKETSAEIHGLSQP
jgi:hypothetical protein